MTPEQTSAFFDAGESFVEGTIAAVLVIFWLLVIAMQLARPYMLRNLRKFTLRLGADLWWIIYVALRDLLLVTLFLGGFIFFYPDVVAGKDLPVTGGLATVCAFAVLVLKLVSKGESDVQSFRLQTLLLGLGATLYIVPYVLGVQVTAVGGDTADQLAAILVSSRNTDVSLPLCYLSGILTGALGLVAVVYNLRQTTIRRPKAAEAPEASR
jgi:hypothetical protein